MSYCELLSHIESKVNFLVYAAKNVESDLVYS